MSYHHHRPSLRALAATLGVSHSSLSSLFRAGGLRTGLALDGRGRLYVTDADAVAAEWRAGRVARPGEAERATAWKVANGAEDEIRLDGARLVVGDGDAAIVLDPVALVGDFLALEHAAALLAFAFLDAGGAPRTRELVAAARQLGERPAALVTSLLKEARAARAGKEKP